MWDIALELDTTSTQALFLQIARGIADAIKAGRLKAGDQIPGSRRLAEKLGVHRNTVLAAYNDLIAQGWIITKSARGSFVAPSFPGRKAPQKPLKTQLGRASSPSYPLVPSTYEKVVDEPLDSQIISLAAGQADLRELPFQDWSRAMRRVLQRAGPRLMNYGDPQGHLPLRQELLKMLSLRRALFATPSQCILTRGSQMAIYLSARMLIKAGDLVAVENFGYPPAWRAFRQAGAHLTPLPVDKDGLRIDALEALLKKESIRALYLTPHHQYPTQAVLSAPRRVRVLDLARRHQFAIIEDDYDHEFHYSGPPVLPLASMDDHGSVIYIGTLSKVFAPGLRLGYAIAPEPIIEGMVRLRLCIDRQGSPLEEAALTELFEDGLMERHIRRMTRLYKKRRDHLCQELRHHFPHSLRFSIPKGGMATWAKIIDGHSPEAWREQALREGVYFTTGARYAFDGQSTSELRLGYALQDLPQLSEAVQRMKRAWKRVFLDGQKGQSGRERATRKPK